MHFVGQNYRDNMAVALQSRLLMRKMVVNFQSIVHLISTLD